MKRSILALNAALFYVFPIHAADLTYGGVTHYSGTSVVASNYAYGNAYLNAKNNQSAGASNYTAHNNPTGAPVPPKASQPQQRPVPRTTQSVPPTPAALLNPQVPAPKYSVLPVTSLTPAQNVPQPLAYNVPPKPVQTISQPVQMVPPAPAALLNPQVPTPKYSILPVTNLTPAQSVPQPLAYNVPPKPAQLTASIPAVTTRLKTAPLTPTVTATTAVPVNPTTTINVAAGDLPKNTLIVTPTGEVVLAGTLPPTTQVEKPFVSVFVTPPRSRHTDHSRSTGGHGDSNGTENAQNSRSAGGFSTRNDHIGGGAAGGGFHY